jgi:hypothetical protein
MRSFCVPIYNSPVETEETNGTPSVAIADNALKILDWHFSKENLESSIGSKNFHTVELYWYTNLFGMACVFNASSTHR